MRAFMRSELAWVPYVLAALIGLELAIFFEGPLIGVVSGLLVGGSVSGAFTHGRWFSE